MNDAVKLINYITKPKYYIYPNRKPEDGARVIFYSVFYKRDVYYHYNKDYTPSYGDYFKFWRYA